jgi:hypothetical protein
MQAKLIIGECVACRVAAEESVPMRRIWTSEDKYGKGKTAVQIRRMVLKGTGAALHDIRAK